MDSKSVNPQMDQINQTSAGTAFKGFDPVAYFTDGRAMSGSTEFTHDWRGARWQFSSAANRDKFAGDPEQYAPQYGGYCAHAMSQNSIADVDPGAWKIVDGKLYLNFSKNALDKWEQDQAANISKADQYWSENEAQR